MTKLLYQKQHEVVKWLQDPTLKKKYALQNVTFANNSILMSRGNAGLHNKQKKQACNTNLSAKILQCCT